jgi:peptidoglycan/LPS O-acetylase OafA/YrhL
LNLHSHLPTALSGPAERVFGWDLLRGMCALAVAAYHLMFWQDLASIHTLGSYGVYLFFVLSGASLAYNYVDKMQSGRFSWPQFLWVRYWRLAPRYVALMLIALPWKVLNIGLSTDLLTLYLLNATFLFGFFNPSMNAVLVGGWSLGIEAIYYLLFPLLMMSFARLWLVITVFVLLLVTQIAWIAGSVGQGGYNLENTALYFQAPAFAAYFMGGCILGVVKRKKLHGSFPHPQTALIILLTGFGLMMVLNPVLAGDEITGWRGFVLGGMCLVMVYAASCWVVPDHMVNLARYFGDATYGLYLLHPVLFFGMVQIVFPRLGISHPGDWAVSSRILFGAAIIVLAFGLALLSERYFENPLRTLLKSRHNKARETMG